MDKKPNVNALLESCDHTRNPVEYMPGKHDKKGRAFGEGSIGNVSKWITRLVSGYYYESIDISNAAATILVQLADRERVKVPALFSKYVNGERDSMQKLFLEQVGREDTPATMQSCITGENVAVPRKNKTAVTHLRWKSPGIMAGNWVMNYNDEQGQWKRRLALFLWLLIPGSVQADLKERIAQSELPYLLLRCIARYRIAVQEKPGAYFWQDIAPEELRQNQKYVESRMNVLARFLHEGSKQHGVIPDKGRLTPWPDFISAYEGYLKEMKQSNAKAENIPDSTLHQNGFKVFPPRAGLGVGRGVGYKKDGRVNYCSFCPHIKFQVGHECDPAGVCREGLCWRVNCSDKDHRGAGRGKSFGIVNMRIVPKAEFDQWLLGTAEPGSESEPDESPSESPSVREWQERVWALAAQENTDKIRRATKKMLEANSRAERKAERRRGCRIAGIRNWGALKKKYRRAKKRAKEERQAQGSCKRPSQKIRLGCPTFCSAVSLARYRIAVQESDTAALIWGASTIAALPAQQVPGKARV
eukprot:g35022.t1